MGQVTDILFKNNTLSSMAKKRIGNVRRFCMRMIVESITLDVIESWRPFQTGKGLGRMAGIVMAATLYSS